MKNFGSLSYELQELAINLALLPWLVVCFFIAAAKGELPWQS